MIGIKNPAASIRSARRHGPLSIAGFAALPGALLLSALLLTGCAGSPATLEPVSASQLQAGVLKVTTSAAAGDFSTAQAELAAVQADLLAASAADQLTASRASQIQAAIDLVRADLAAAITASLPTPVATRTPSSPTPSSSSADKSDSGNSGKNDCKKKDDDCD
jgi:hypothetical protein